MTPLTTHQQQDIFQAEITNSLKNEVTEIEESAPGQQWAEFLPLYWKLQ